MKPSLLNRILEARPRGAWRAGVWMLVLTGCAAGFAVHYLTGPDLDPGSIFLVPCVAAAWYLGARAGIATVAISAAAWFAAETLLASGTSGTPALFNTLSRFAAYFVLVVVLAQVRTLLLRLGELSRTDSLTGLGNPRALRERGEHDLDMARRAGSALSLVFIDVDNFKEVNDREGHAAGDRVLQQVAEALRAILRRSDFAARLGGDEFAVLLVGSDAASAREVAVKIREGVEERMRANTFSVTLSIGVATAAEGASFAALLEAGDGLMYEAKGEGKDAIVTSAVAQ